MREPAIAADSGVDERRVRSGRTRVRESAIKVTLLMFSLALALILGELLVRTLAPRQLYRFPQGLFVSHPDLGFRLAADFEGVMTTTEYRATIRTNAAGFRETRDYGPRAGDTLRILALGDSFAMGVGADAEQSFLKLLESRLSQAGHTGVEIVNAGVPGYNTTQAGVLFELERGRLRPDLVLLHFYVGNDVHDNLHQPRITVVDGFLSGGIEKSTVLPRGLRQMLQRRSHLYAFLWPLQRALRDSTFREEQRVARTEHWSMYATRADDSTEALWKATESELRIVADRKRKSRTDLVVVIIPEPMQVSAASWQVAAPEPGAIDPGYRREFPNRKIAELCRELELPVLDLFPTFDGSDSGGPTYFRIDGHWTPRGNVLAADAIARFLLERPELLDPAGRRGEVLGAPGR